MVTSIAASLNIGAGIDTAKLIADLTAAQRAPKDAILKQRQSANSAQISGVASIANALDSFVSALKALMEGGSLLTKPTSSNADVLALSPVAGHALGGLSAQVEVIQLAASQSIVSGTVADPTAAIGRGTLTIASGSSSFDVVIDENNDSLNGLAAAINAAKKGITATVVKDAGGSRLMLRAQSGEENVFTVAAKAGADPALSAFTYDGVGGGGMTLAQAARDAIVKLDGLEVHRASNSFDDLLPGVKFDLKQAAPGTIINIGFERQTETVKQALNDFVAAYNEVEAMIDQLTASGLDGTSAGPLRGSSALHAIREQLGALAGMQLFPGDDRYARLTSFGVATTRDGSLKVDGDKLKEALDANPDALEALFNPTNKNDGLLAALERVRDTITKPEGLLDGIKARLNSEAKVIERDVEAHEMRMEAYGARLVASFAAMDSRVASLKATQSYLDQQIKMWTNSKG